ncbi:MAG: signal peptide peptidase SppA [Phycisphaeraceae bacterium]
MHEFHGRIAKRITPALVLALTVFSSIAVAAPQAPGSEQQNAEAADDNAAQQQNASVVGWLELSGALRDGPVPFAWVNEADAKPSLRDVLGQLDHVATNDQYLGVVVHMDRPELELTEASAIAAAIERVRDSGKKVFTYAEEYNLTTYLTASAADQVLLQHHGRVHLRGLAIEEMYLAGLLAKIGAKADLMQVGRFKGAADPLVRTEPSDAWNQNMDGLLDDLYTQVIEQIAQRRGMTVEAFEQIMAESWAMTDEQYIRQRVVDQLVDRDLVDATEIVFGHDFTWDDTLGRSSARQAMPQNPFALFRMMFQETETRTNQQSLAVIHAYGPVTSGESARGDGLFASNSIGSKTIIQMLGRVRDDDMIHGAVIRINSPGGSALASEVIWQAVRETAEKKPVFISIGRLAASGGYYIACAGDEIYVSPQSIVGSIGVVGGKVVLGDLYDKLAIHVHRRNRGPLADMFNSAQPFTDEQREALRQGLERVYAQFTDRVQVGRGKRVNDIEQVARGRLFSGRQATENGLADELGGLDVALRDLAERAGLEPGAYQVVHLPPPMSLGEFVNNLFGANAAQAGVEAAPWLATARRVLGPQSWEAASSVMSGLMLLREEPTLMLMPYAIVVE